MTSFYFPLTLKNFQVRLQWFFKSHHLQVFRLCFCSFLHQPCSTREVVCCSLFHESTVNLRYHSSILSFISHNNLFYFIDLR
uniref:Uncharacterized protein n=1 Tax=Helianthus annuus TaxID=4232 RepID=A0A251V765_HELAN